MLQTVRCIRFGAVLMDENRRSFLLCENCHNDYRDLEDFRLHLQSCLGLEHLFQPNTTIGFGCAKEASQLLGKSLSGAKQYLIYNINDALAIEPPSTEMNYKNDKNENYMDLIKIEEELLDPRWYTDLTSVQSEMATTTTTTTTSTTSNTSKADKMLEYNELVEAVTPFVQFKENVRTSNQTSIRATKKSKDLVETKLVLNANGPMQNGLIVGKKQGAGITAQVKTRNPPIAKRRLSMQKVVSSVTTTLPLEQSSAKLKLLLNAEKDVLKQKLPTQKPELPQPIGKRRKTIAIPMENVQIQPELFETEDINWKRDIAQILAKPTKSNLKTYQKREKTSLPQQPQQQHTKTVCFRDAAPAITSKQAVKCNAAIPATPPPPIVAAHAAPQQKPQKIVVTKAKPISIVTSIPTQMIPPAANEKKQTEQILNKLQTLGLQVKRTNPPPPPPPLPPPVAPNKTDETLELLKKLQSKGMNVKILNKNTNATSSCTQITKKPRLSSGSLTTTTPAQPTQHAISSNAAKSKFNKGIIIKKVK